jgi:hypothetical protein
MVENIVNNKRYILYKHTNKINGKCYIGITNQKPEKRWGNNGINYLKKTKHDTYYQPKFAYAILKYSWDNFEHEILFENLTIDEAKQKEIELISYYNAIDNGYNIEAGGNCVVCSIEKPVKQYTKEGLFIQEYDSVRQASEITGINRSDIGSCCRDNLKTAGNFIWRFSVDELTDEHLTWCNDNGRYDRCISVCQYSKDGILIAEHQGIQVAARAVGASHTNILCCCMSYKKTCKGYIWRYADEPLTKEYLKWCNAPRNEHIQRSVSQYTKQGIFICTYPSIKDASLKTGVNHTNIASCCRNEAKSAGSFLWRYAEDKITDGYLKWCNEKKKQFHRDSTIKSVIQYTINGNFIAVYKSINQASEATGISRRSIKNVCDGNAESSKGFIWRYASNAEDSSPVLSQIA